MNFFYHYFLNKTALLTLIFKLLTLLGFSQNNNGVISGTVKDSQTQETIIGAVVTLEGTSLGAVTDLDGNFIIKSIPPASYNVIIKYTGYQVQTLFNVVVTNGNNQVFSIDLEPLSVGLEGIEIVANTYGKKTETPLSIQSLTAEEIKNNPGGNYDISRAVQALPGVGGGTSAARNDLIIRGGASNENVFYLDGIEIPQINHFATQGATGGAQGILNVSFIEDVSVATSSFGAKYDNALSGVLQFKQRDGNSEKMQGSARISSTEVALNTDGPIGKNTTMLASMRRSYLQFFFEAIDLPIRPNYWDFQFKISHKLNEKTTLTFLGLGSIDEFSFAVPKESDPSKEFIIRSNPSINQLTNTTGISVKRLIKNGFLNVALSRNVFQNELLRYEDAQFGDESKLNFKSFSDETENKLRIDFNQIFGKWKLSYGASAQYVEFKNDFFNIINVPVNGTPIRTPIRFESELDFFKYGFFASVNRKVLQDRLSLTLGIRNDMNTFTDNGDDLANTLSPRFTASYALSQKVNLNASVGRYFKVPIYTVLGFKGQDGSFVNRDNDYIQTDHLVLGTEYLPTNSLRITLEGFYKAYSNYPVLQESGVSLANFGSTFGAIGNERVLSVGKGRSYGVELFVQQKLTKGYYVTASYTYFISEFTGLNSDEYFSSAWDTRNILSTIFGKKFKKGWEVGAKFRWTGRAPFTPYDEQASREDYLVTGNGTFDFTRLNSERLPAFTQLDIRIDKKFNFKKSSLNVFIDFQNALLAKNRQQDSYTFQRNETNTGFATTDGQALRADGSNAIPILIQNVDESFIPALGIIFEF